MKLQFARIEKSVKGSGMEVECMLGDRFGIHPIWHYICWLNFPGGADGKASAYNVGHPGLSPGSGRSPREGNGNPLQYSCLENPMDGRTW